MKRFFGTAVVGLVGAILGSFSMMLFASTHFTNVAGPGNTPPAAERSRAPGHRRQRSGTDRQRGQTRRAVGRFAARHRERHAGRPERSVSAILRRRRRQPGYSAAFSRARFGFRLRLPQQRTNSHEQSRRAEGRLEDHGRVRERRSRTRPRVLIEPGGRSRARQSRQLREAPASGGVRRQHETQRRSVGDRRRRTLRTQAIRLGRRRLSRASTATNPFRTSRVKLTSSAACSKPRRRSIPVTRAALTTPSSRSLADAARRSQHAHVAAPVPAEPRRDEEHVDEGTLREYVRIELLVARARAER